MKNTDLQKLINQIVDERITENITQVDFAKRLGIKKSNLSRIEHGKENISIETLIKMVNEFSNSFNLRFETIDTNDTLYSLKLFNIELLTFEFKEEPLIGKIPNIISINKEYEHLLPFGLQQTNESLLSFLQKRAIPKNRAFVEKILKSLGTTKSDLQGILDISLSLSLNDCYWITKKSFKGKFESYNLYNNNFSTSLALLAYTGYGSSHIVITTSPELTTNGALPKAWRRVDNKVFLFKGSTSGYSNTGNEAFCEFYASQILDKMGLNHVRYDLIKWKGILASVCPLFTSLEISFVPTCRLTNAKNLKDIINHAKSINIQFEEAIKSMLVFDCLIFNEDRHLSNFGYLYNSDTKEIIDTAPIFDNGNSLFHYANNTEIDDLDSYSKTRTNPYGIPFNDIAKNVIGSTQKEQLRKLIGFKFKRHEKYNWSEHRLIKTEEFLQRRIKELLEM